MGAGAAFIKLGSSSYLGSCRAASWQHGESDADCLLLWTCLRTHLTCIRHSVNSSFAAQVQYGNAADNTTVDMVIVTLTVRYPEPAMIPSEQAAIATIYNQCVHHLCLLCISA